jgi:flagellar biosynthesis protein FliP
MKMLTNNFVWLKLLLIVLLCLCLFKMPYSYYELVRFIALIGFLILAYQEFKNEVIPLAITYAGLALLFQPFFKIALGRELWNGIDVIVSIALLISIFIKNPSIKSKNSCTITHSKNVKT